MLYSIIIPQYNSSSLLKRLLLSIPNNGLFQVIVVDDYSSNVEYEAVTELNKSFVFELYSNESTTAGGARNTGLKYAKGKWIIFADADDYFEPNMFTLLSKYEETDYDIVFFNVTSRYSDSGEDAYRHEHIVSISEKALANNDMDYLRCCYTAPWGKMIKRDIIKGISFDEVIAGNDMWFSVNVGLKAEKVCWENEPLYCITVTSNSITTTLSKDRFESRLQVTLRVNQLLRTFKKNKFQISILYFIAKSYQFGFSYFVHVLYECIRHKSNPFIGLKKIFSFGKVLRDRQNTNLNSK